MANTGVTQGMSGNYNANSSVQMDLVNSSLSYIKEAIQLLKSEHLSDPIIIADFGSSHGLNSIHAMKTIIQHLKQIDQQKQTLVIHNDLPTNNWTELFQLLNTEQPYHGVACGRSFYESCLPSNSLSVAYSSSSLHWLSRKPCNIVNHCNIYFGSPDEIQQFKNQAKLDYNTFIQHRANELRSGGALILTIACSNENGSSGWHRHNDVFYKCAKTLFTSEELLNYTMPIYNRSFSECIDHELFERCSLKLIKTNLHNFQFPRYDQFKNGKISADEYAKILKPMTQTWSESILKQALASNGRSQEDIENTLKKFWILYEKELEEFLKTHQDGLSYYITFLILQKI